MKYPISKESKIYIAGHNGLVGSALWRNFTQLGYTNLVGWSSSDLDLRNREDTIEAIGSSKPEVVLMAAGKVGGILANKTYPVDFLSDNVRMMANVFEASHIANVEKLLFLGSSCIYPKFASQPIDESSLLTGPLESTNEAYAIAKIAGVLHIQGYRQQYARNWISAMPTNLYGPFDNFDLSSSHVLPAMIRKFHDAKHSQNESVTLWGTGSPRREFLYVDDLALGCIHLLENYNEGEPINIGTGIDIEIRELANLVATTVGFEGRIIWDESKPDGTPKKQLNTQKIASLGWTPKVELKDGIRKTYEWFLENSE